jgi:hypothetical protein
VHAPVQFTSRHPATQTTGDVFVGTDAEHRLPQLITAEDVLTTAPLPVIFSCRDAFVVLVPPPPVPPPLQRTRTPVPVAEIFGAPCRWPVNA